MGDTGAISHADRDFGIVSSVVELDEERIDL